MNQTIGAIESIGMAFAHALNFAPHGFAAVSVICRCSGFGYSHSSFHFSRKPGKGRDHASMRAPFYSTEGLGSSNSALA